METARSGISSVKNVPISCFQIIVRGLARRECRRSNLCTPLTALTALTNRYISGQVGMTWVATERTFKTRVAKTRVAITKLVGD